MPNLIEEMNDNIMNDNLPNYPPIMVYNLTFDKWVNAINTFNNLRLSNPLLERFNFFSHDIWSFCIYYNNNIYFCETYKIINNENVLVFSEKYNN